MLRAEPYPWDTVSAPDRTRWFRISTPTLAPRGLDHGVGGPPRPAPPQSILRATGPPPRGDGARPDVSCHGDVPYAIAMLAFGTSSRMSTVVIGLRLNPLTVR